jgi:hypothetical protein
VLTIGTAIANVPALGSAIVPAAPSAPFAPAAPLLPALPPPQAASNVRLTRALIPNKILRIKELHIELLRDKRGTNEEQPADKLLLKWSRQTTIINFFQFNSNVYLVQNCIFLVIFVKLRINASTC